MLGAVVKATNFITLDALLKNLSNKWKGEWGEKLQKSVKMAHDQLKCNKS